jgi:hypothetical protein
MGDEQSSHHRFQRDPPTPTRRAQLPERPFRLSLPLAPLPAFADLVAVLVICVHDAFTLDVTASADQGAGREVRWDAGLR